MILEKKVPEKRNLSNCFLVVSLRIRLFFDFEVQKMLEIRNLQFLKASLIVLVKKWVIFDYQLKYSQT